MTEAEYLMQDTDNTVLCVNRMNSKEWKIREAGLPEFHKQSCNNMKCTASTDNHNTIQFSLMNIS